MVFAGEAMIFVVDSDEAVGQCDDEDMRKLEALAANKADEPSNKTQEQTENELEPKEGTAQPKFHFKFFQEKLQYSNDWREKFVLIFS